eukprot:GABV01014166.1.p1 GENE.GABV01014166.1~~GABV01014166.1.p1  ORF type:complete len:108 (-),score=36.85 GABV01014166.1:11-334(-)
MKQQLNRQEKVSVLLEDPNKNVLFLFEKKRRRNSNNNSGSGIDFGGGPSAAASQYGWGMIPSAPSFSAVMASLEEGGTPFGESEFENDQHRHHYQFVQPSSSRQPPH